MEIKPERSSVIESMAAIGADTTATHLIYLRRDIDEVRLNQKLGFDRLEAVIAGVGERLDRMRDGLVTTSDFSELAKRVDDHETRTRLIEETQWKRSSISAIISAMVTSIGFIIVAFFAD